MKLTIYSLIVTITIVWDVLCMIICNNNVSYIAKHAVSYQQSLYSSQQYYLATHKSGLPILGYSYIVYVKHYKELTLIITVCIA